ncbi:MAG: hypothetical protein HS128_19175 [Ideonella sp.]|nr:hypothetical protein [Ideonella sp.]MCC7455987.1 hypothetical protein [Nitrospira sp.]
MGTTSKTDEPKVALAPPKAYQDKPEAAAPLKDYQALMRLEVAGMPYAPGAKVSLSERDAAPLLAGRVIQPMPEADAAT